VRRIVEIAQAPGASSPNVRCREHTPRLVVAALNAARGPGRCGRAGRELHEFEVLAPGIHHAVTRSRARLLPSRDRREGGARRCIACVPNSMTITAGRDELEARRAGTAVGAPMVSPNSTDVARTNDCFLRRGGTLARHGSVQVDQSSRRGIPGSASSAMQIERRAADR
jgi:hypothetical protein